ncbi:hypothetical protein ACF5W4_09180 [Bacillota bacterium Lsc_1132]
MNNWLNALFNTGRRQPLFNIFGKRRNNSGMVWGSLIGLGLSAAAFGLTRNRNRISFRPFQGLMNNPQMGMVKNQNMAGLTEFAKEMVPNKNPFNNK